jgi:hypothetical protein
LLPPQGVARRYRQGRIRSRRITAALAAFAVEGGVMSPTRRSTRPSCGSIARYFPLGALVGAWLSATASPAVAADIVDPDTTADGHAATSGPVNLLPEAVAARVTSDRVSATTWAGYDGGKRAPMLTIAVEARLAGRVVLMAGGGYTAEMPGAAALRPQVGLRVQLLDQAKQGVDGGVALTYRQDLFTIEGGFFQGAVALERQQGRLRLVGNLIYGQDGEADDRAGEVRLAALVEARPGLLFGLDGRYRHDLWSSDPNRVTRDRPVSELMAGPTASYTVGAWAVMAEAGVSAVHTTNTETGLIALAGLGSCF